MKYILILLWLSVSWDELQIENYVEYPTLKACETHWDDAKSQKGKEGYPNRRSLHPERRILQKASWGDFLPPQNAPNTYLVPKSVAEMTYYLSHGEFC